jgi:hypothetical protein
MSSEVLSSEFNYNTEEQISILVDQLHDFVSLGQMENAKVLALRIKKLQSGNTM